ncbi:SusC/RagA family TonB-linked outer membrane protein [Chitinophaga sp. SYP-B3965]|uniref:SusC/RagA family TonB-linked outer membrane protein n=1 Tax=Chitinophaga sp. SYP-B3965 TaxID=2663120 RepID=UPI001299D78C|nr:TonB-dependent receptor [Chitinophaga sp. SYP-B3965]MRG44960.1 SusC/RagA family TonB-linked outer membrane protein [Chitinophaga sp. SYP-B3965]
MKKLITTLCMLCGLLLSAGAQVITGTITSSDNGERLPGAGILEKGKTNATRSDSAGHYKISVTDPNGTLIISYVGYKTKEIKISGQSKIDVVLDPTASSMQEVVVVGYGTQQRKDITGSISTISASKIKNQPAVSVDQLLQGRAAGVDVSQASGAPGGRLNIRIRGASSLNAGNEPLFVIDDVPVYNNSKDPSGTSYGTFTATNALASLNPNDIESMQVLKDASATAIYGSRGSNGVIIITTKRGSGNRMSVDYNGYYGIQTVANKLDLMNGEQHAAYLNDWALSRNLPKPFAKPDSIGKGTDWQDELFRPAVIQNHQVSLSSGKGNLKYFVSGNYFNQDGIVINSNMKRYSFRVNADANLTDKVKFTQSLSYSRTINSSVPTTGAGSGNVRSVGEKIYETSPTIPVFDENGEYVDYWYNAGKAESPVASLLSVKNKLQGDNFLGNVALEYKPFANLTFKSLVGINLTNRSNQEYYPKATTYIGGLLGGLGMIGERKITNILNENTVRYTKIFKEKHNLELLGGFSWQKEQDFSATMEPSKFADDRLGLNSIGSATGATIIGSSLTEWSMASFIARANYQYDNKYLLTASFRADGSSKFGADNKWGYFPSVAVGYRLSEEPFMKDLKFLSDLKLRGSYGLTGNQEIGSYQSLATLTTSNAYIFDNKLFPAARHTRLVNGELKWEKTGQWDIGLDAAFFNNRLRLTADYYKKATRDLLFTIDLQAYSGYSSALYNTGGLENKGVELNLGADIFTGNFTWTADFNFAHNKTKVTSLGRATSTTLFVGYPPGNYLGYVYEGVFHNQAEIDAQTVQTTVKPGDARYKDVTGDGFLNADDRVVMGNSLPEFTYGFSNVFGYKNFSLTIFLQGAAGANRIEDTGLNDPSGSGNKSVNLLNRWTPGNPNSNIPRAGYSNVLTSTYQLMNASYLKIRNAQLSYAFRGGTSIYVSGQNLFTKTDYIGYDPDGGGGYPTATTLMFGINLKL